MNNLERRLEALEKSIPTGQTEVWINHVPDDINKQYSFKDLFKVQVVPPRSSPTDIRTIAEFTEEQLKKWLDEKGVNYSKIDFKYLDHWHDVFGESIAYHGNQYLKLLQLMSDFQEKYNLKPFVDISPALEAEFQAEFEKILASEWRADPAMREDD